MFIRKDKTSNHGCPVTVNPERPVHKKPQIAETYYQDGVRMYETIDNRHFIADVLDKIFDPIRGKVKRKGYKGKNPDTTAIFVN